MGIIQAGWMEKASKWEQQSCCLGRAESQCVGMSGVVIARDNNMGAATVMMSVLLRDSPRAAAGRTRRNL